MDNQTGLAILSSVLGSVSIQSQIFSPEMDVGMGVGKGFIGVDKLHQLTCKAVVGGSSLAVGAVACSASVPTGTVILPPSLLDEQYHYDFTNVSDIGVKFYRGGSIYNRPCGWQRYAFKLDGKYSDDIWLKGRSRRADQYSSAEDEWPVSYHGTSLNNGLNIAEEGFDLSKGKRFLHGHGIYSTPDINVAMQYAVKTGEIGRNRKKYKVIIQNRVNPENLLKVDKAVTGVGEYWISPDGDDIRPYGFCVKEIPDGNQSIISNCLLS